MATVSFQEQLAADLVATVAGEDGGDLIVVAGTEWWAERVAGQPSTLVLEQPGRRLLVQLHAEITEAPTGSDS